MPLSHGTSKAARSKNIAELIRNHHTVAQSAAIAYKEQRKAIAKKAETKKK